MTIANEILEQLGGRRFIVMTGSKNFLDDGNTLRMTLAKNASKANRLEITLNGLDLYDIKFTKYTPSKLVVNHAKGTAEWREEKVETVAEFDNMYNDDLQHVFTKVTGMYTHF